MAAQKHAPYPPYAGYAGFYMQNTCHQKAQKKSPKGLPPLWNPHKREKE
jgi:hypothetical protein